MNRLALRYGFRFRFRHLQNVMSLPFWAVRPPITRFRVSLAEGSGSTRSCSCSPTSTHLGSLMATPDTARHPGCQQKPCRASPPSSLPESTATVAQARSGSWQQAQYQASRSRYKPRLPAIPIISFHYRISARVLCSTLISDPGSHAAVDPKPVTYIHTHLLRTFPVTTCAIELGAGAAAHVRSSPRSPSRSLDGITITARPTSAAGAASAIAPPICVICRCQLRQTSRFF